MKTKSTPLVDDHLQSLEGMQEVGTDNFFYSRLQASILARQSAVASKTELHAWGYRLKPGLVFGTLALLFTVNIFLLFQQSRNQSKIISSSSALQNFAQMYDQAISSPY